MYMSNDKLSVLEKFKKELYRLKKIDIFLGEKSSEDEWASALALALSLYEDGVDDIGIFPINTNTDIAYKGLTFVKNDLKANDLIISLPYIKEKIDEVKYEIDEEKKTFNLIIKPAKGESPIFTEDVKVFHNTLDVDVIVLYGIDDFSELGELYTEYKKDFDEVIKFWFRSPLEGRNTDQNVYFLDKNGLSSLSEYTTLFLNEFKLPLNKDIATNLFWGLKQATASFSKNIKPSTFEVGAFLLRKGAKQDIEFIEKKQSKKIHGSITPSQVKKQKQSKKKVQEPIRRRRTKISVQGQINDGVNKIENKKQKKQVVEKNTAKSQQVKNSEQDIEMQQKSKDAEMSQTLKTVFADYEEKFILKNTKKSN